MWCNVCISYELYLSYKHNVAEEIQSSNYYPITD